MAVGQIAHYCAEGHLPEGQRREGHAALQGHEGSSPQPTALSLMLIGVGTVSTLECTGEPCTGIGTLGGYTYIFNLPWI